METESLLPSKPTYYGGIKSYLRRRCYQRGSSGSGGRKQRLAGNIGSLNTQNNVVFGGKRIPKPRQFSMRFSGDAFEARLIYEIFKTLVAFHELNPM
ncbi:hypothetical protein HN51_016409 [Arachis hypogaea]